MRFFTILIPFITPLALDLLIHLLYLSDQSNAAALSALCIYPKDIFSPSDVLYYHRSKWKPNTYPPFNSPILYKQKRHSLNKIILLS